MGLELDEYVFGKVVKYLKKRKENNKEVLARSVFLEDMKPRLTLMARALTGHPIEIFPAEREGGYKDNNFFLPISVALFENKERNVTFYFFRIAYLSCQKELDLNWQDMETIEELSQSKARETSKEVLRLLFAQYPSMELWYKLALQDLSPRTPKEQDNTFWLFGKWMTNSYFTTEPDILSELNAKTASKAQDIQTTLKARAVEEIESLTIDKKQQEDYVLLHNFEKIETAEEFNGNWRDFDGKDVLNDHKDALEEMNMRFTVRVDDPAHSVYQADFVENTTIAQSAEVDQKGFHLKYDEWDYKKRRYQLNFCKVYPRTQLKSDPVYYQKTITKHRTTLIGLRKIITSINNKLQFQRRQLQGDEFDLDALTDLYADLHSGKSPDERIYLSKRKKNKDIAILLLLDNSLSSDSYAGGNRVIDVEKEVSILFGELFHEFDIQFAIDGFYSKTRNFTTYTTFKDFTHHWNTAKSRIGTAEPNGYTRIGPALRHAGARLDQTEAKNKWIILLSDGKPNDYDRYEGQHGIQDIKQALRELNQRKINSYALAIEAQAKYYLPQMFGQNHYQILTSPEELVQSLVKLYKRIKYQ
ncbi:nitric oxide reductase activation protein NorD [Imtechella halotolerans]|uniref:NorD protein n=1 Tax=Imtechella halotolerans K1 TaxID=946077 RepID=I0WBX3_9FLAO|nr:VWA domain-containing protein [Imtechella halotolerans]EID73889.1 NorD protein [Imtechella halotolerans K1]WMQ64099.1 VWA domain-containing protein [Imtechella halotolerans]